MDMQTRSSRSRAVSGSSPSSPARWRWFGLGRRREAMRGRGQVGQGGSLVSIEESAARTATATATATAEERRESLYFDTSSGHEIGNGSANNMDLSGSSGSSGMGDSTGSASRSPSPRTPTTAEALEWAEWLRTVQKNFAFLRRLDAEMLFGEQQAQEMRLSAAATIIRMRGLVGGPVRFYPEIQELAERAGFSFDFFSRAYLSRLAVALLFFLFSAYTCAVASMVAGHRTPYVMVLDLDGRPTPQYTLPDYGHDLTHFILNWLGYSEAYINVHHLPDTITAWVSFVTMLFMLAHPRRFLILRRTTIIFAILFLFRAFTVTVTSLPDASPVCRAQFLNGAGYKREPIFPRSFARAFKFMLSPTTTVTCGDAVFSGHTTVLTMCSMIFWRYCRGKYLCTKVFFRSFHIPERACMVVRRLVYLTTIVGAIIIVSTRFHYTLDVAIGLYLTQRTFRYYHDAALYPNLLRDSPLAAFLRWMEAEEIVAIDEAAYRIYRKKT